MERETGEGWGGGKREAERRRQKDGVHMWMEVGDWEKGDSSPL